MFDCWVTLALIQLVWVCTTAGGVLASPLRGPSSSVATPDHVATCCNNEGRLMQRGVLLAMERTS